MANKKYIAIITEETDDFSLDYFVENPWKGNLREIAKGNTVDELIKDADDSEGMFYQLYETSKGKRLGYGVFTYDAIKEDIDRDKPRREIIDGRMYIVMTVSQLAEYTVSRLNFKSNNFISCDYCVLDEEDKEKSIKELLTNASSWMGIKPINTGFDNHDLDIASDYYGGGALAVTCLTCDMSQKERINDVIRIITETISYFDDAVREDTLLFVERNME